MMRRKLCNILAALFSILCVFPFVFMTMDRQLPMLLKPIGIKPVVVESGITATVTWDAIRKREFGPGLFECQGSFYRRITDAGGFITESKPQAIDSFVLIGESRTAGEFSYDVIMPILLPGPASYQVISTYWCNPLQKWLLPIFHKEETIHFMVNEQPLRGPKGDTGKQGETGETGKQGETGRAGKDR